ncbi:MAG: PfkB family carbohydrate kinase [Candidatus Borkfalkiaceae bacterium]|nr:PfkB family carbohydrate kinase [Clostridia bacterium]MDY6223685.1 PfkB family carbohydrate kinase [Christensenellaceae bacterium]
MKKVVGLGACVLDTLISCDTYPREDTKQKAESVFVSGGGPVGNALVVMSKLGLNASVLGNFAGDTAGVYLLNDFKKYGVDTSYAHVVKNASSFTSYILLSADKKTRTCLFDRGTVPDDPAALDFSVLDSAAVLHLDGNYLRCAVAAAKYAKEKGVKVSLDAGGLYENIQTLLPYADILIPSAEFAKGITGAAEIPAAMEILQKKYAPEILAVTDGSNGGFYWNGERAVHYESVKVNAVDTNGAGDTFHGAFIAAYCEGKTPEESCAFANKVAAYKCTQKGARTYPLSKEIAQNLF